MVKVMALVALLFGACVPNRDDDLAPDAAPAAVPDGPSAAPDPKWPDYGWGAACTIDPADEGLCTNVRSDSVQWIGVCVPTVKGSDATTCMPRCAVFDGSCEIAGCPVHVDGQACYCAPC